MKTSKFKITRLSDYTPPPFLIESADFHFILDPRETRVKSTLHIKRNLAAYNQETAIILDGINLQLQEIKLNQKPLAKNNYQVTPEHLSIAQVPNDFILETTVKINPESNLTCSGLYLTNNNFCTQNEPNGMPLITYFINRPDILTKFTTTIDADQDKCPILLANGNLIKSEKLPHNQHRAIWEDPFPKSPYLFALVAGKFSWVEDYHITSSGRKITLRIFAAPEQLDQCNYALTFLKQAMQWDEQNFNLEYDLDLYQIVAVNDFVFGAMENKGLNVFNSSVLLASPATATDADFKRIAAVVAHEYFHNWTGNRVTCRDWFQLGLKEGLTTLREQLFMEDTYGEPVNRIDTIKTIYNKQFPEDSGPLAHPVRLKSYIEVDNFYTPTVYYKSAEIARMLKTIFGKKVLQQIMQKFLAKFDGKAVTIEDFLQVASNVTHTNLEQFKLWYDQSGTPLLNIEDDWTRDKTYLLKIKQEHQKASQNFYLPLALGLIDANGINTPTEVLIIDKSEQSFTFKNFVTKPLPSLLRNFSAPVKIQYPYSNEELLFLIAHDQDPINRWQYAQKLEINIITKLCLEPKTSTALEELIMMFKIILSAQNVDPALAAQMLQLPTENYLLEVLPHVALETIHDTCEFIKIEVARRLENELLTIYKRKNLKKPYDLEALSIGNRDLKNTCLYYLMHLNTDEIFVICNEQLEHADNLTDIHASLTAIANSGFGKREQILEKYYQKWQAQPNLVNKWLAINANIKLTGNLKRIQKLLNHPAFNLKNPNNVFALIRTFCENNLINFHLSNGEGYKFLADQIITIDKFNHQLAALITLPLTFGHKLEQHRRELMQQQLIRINQEPGLSKNVYEIISKALAATV